MRSDDLVRLSTQIAKFFEPYPEETAIAGVHNHLTRFWVPGMRESLLAMRQAGTPLLHPLVAQAADRMAAGQSG